MTQETDTETPAAADTNPPTHALAHLEGEFIGRWRLMPTFSETEAKRLLAWVASKTQAAAASAPK